MVTTGGRGAYTAWLEQITGHLSWSFHEGIVDRLNTFRRNRSATLAAILLRLSDNEIIRLITTLRSRHICFFVLDDL